MTEILNIQDLQMLEVEELFARIGQPCTLCSYTCRVTAAA